MNKLHAFAFYALVTPVITLGAGSVLAEQSTDQDAKHTDSGSHSALENSQRDKDQQSIHDQGKQRSKNSGSHPAEEKSAQRNQDTKHTDSGSHPAAENSQRDKSGMNNRSYMGSAAANGIQANDLIGAKVRTSSDEKAGSVSDLIIDENGQVLAIVVGAGGFLGMGEKDVAIRWDDVTRSDTSGEQELRIDMTSEELRSAPKFETQD